MFDFPIDKRFGGNCASRGVFRLWGVIKIQEWREASRRWRQATIEGG